MSSQVSYDVDLTFGCHLWTGRLNSNGRPIVWKGSAPQYAYTLAYVAEHGPIADGLVLDHLCRRILCINPAHLEPVTKSENERRKSWPYRCRRQRCARDHDLSSALVTPELGRLCRYCHLESK
jgi:HNH endonuclease